MIPLVSIIIPCYNEEKHIEKVCEDILSQQYPVECLEVFFIDGRSKDRTCEVIQSYIPLHPHFQLLVNDHRYVPYALNQGIRASHGEVIVRIDAHARYPRNYITGLVENLQFLEADNVGGVWNTVPGAPGIIPLGIACSMSSVFGVGNAHYRLGNRQIRQVDTVPFGCYRSSVFTRIGLFDEEMIRNQDDEFNARLIKNGGRIFLIPSVEITYFARDKAGKAARMFYQYGYFKPLVNLKVGRPASLRQFVPPFFVLVLFVLLMSTLWNSKMLFLWLGLLMLHLFTGLVFSITPAIKRRKTALLAVLPLLFLMNHLSYGYGYIKGFIHFKLFRRKAAKMMSSR